MNIILALIIFSVIILFHELGHFLLAKYNDVKVNEFCLGLGPTLFGVTKGETKYSLKLLPFGGACMMEGEDEESVDDRSFNSKTVPQRISIVAAGPVFNFIMAFAFSLILVGSVGFDRPVLTGVKEGFPAQEAGIREGDEIVKLGNKKIHLYREVSVYTYFHAGEDIEVTYKRDGKTHTAVLTPKYDEESGSYLMGIYGTTARSKGSALETLRYSAYEVKYWITSTIESLGQLIRGRVSVNEMSGPVGIVKVIGDTYTQAKSDGVFMVFLNMLNMCILLSANLGVMNLLPIPALDGGRLVFLVVEAVRGKRMDPNKEGALNFVFLMALMALMVVIMFNDIRKIVM
ncbi:MAG: RIP metalloprotease RseP [Eubacterium sp.]|nr:RIP metalloprotease RseP [Eubacterium sp.]